MKPSIDHWIRPSLFRPEATRARHARYFLQAQRADGGFSGREGGSDLYYTSFGLRGLASELGVEAVGSFLAAGDEELFREFSDIAGALDSAAFTSGGWFRTGDLAVYDGEYLTIVDRLKANNPETRAVIMLREPVAMLHSLHLRRVYGGSEDLKRFEDALAQLADTPYGLQAGIYTKDIPKALEAVKRLERRVAELEKQVEADRSAAI
mgnify:CR=1 FL=1